MRAAASSRSSANGVPGSAPSTMFSATVIVSTSMKCWCTMPMPSAMASCGALDAARLAVDQNLAAVGGVEAVGDAHRRRLAGAVLADDGVNGAGLDRDVDVVVGEDAAEALGDVSKLRALLEHRVDHLDFARDDPALRPLRRPRSLRQTADFCCARRRRSRRRRSRDRRREGRP